MGDFELTCRDAGIPLYVLPPHSPKLNGFVERLNRTVREEFWDRHHGPFDLATLQPALRAWEIAYNDVESNQVGDQYEKDQSWN